MAVQTSTPTGKLSKPVIAGIAIGGLLLLAGGITGLVFGLSKGGAPELENTGPIDSKTIEADRKALEAKNRLVVTKAFKEISWGQDGVEKLDLMNPMHQKQLQENKDDDVHSKCADLKSFLPYLRKCIEFQDKLRADPKWMPPMGELEALAPSKPNELTRLHKFVDESKLAALMGQISNRGTLLMIPCFQGCLESFAKDCRDESKTPKDSKMAYTTCVALCQRTANAGMTPMPKEATPPTEATLDDRFDELGDLSKTMATLIINKTLEESWGKANIKDILSDAIQRLNVALVVHDDSFKLHVDDIVTGFRYGVLDALDKIVDIDTAKSFIEAAKKLAQIDKGAMAKALPKLAPLAMQYGEHRATLGYKPNFLRDDDVVEAYRRAKFDVPTFKLAIQTFLEFNLLRSLLDRDDVGEFDALVASMMAKPAKGINTEIDTQLPAIDAIARFEQICLDQKDVAFGPGPKPHQKCNPTAAFDDVFKDSKDAVKAFATELKDKYAAGEGYADFDLFRSLFITDRRKYDAGTPIFNPIKHRPEAFWRSIYEAL